MPQIKTYEDWERMKALYAQQEQQKSISKKEFAVEKLHGCLKGLISENVDWKQLKEEYIMEKYGR